MQLQTEFLEFYNYTICTEKLHGSLVGSTPIFRTLYYIGFYSDCSFWTVL